MHRYRNCSNGGVPGKDRLCLGFTNETAPCNGIKCRGRFTLFTVDLYSWCSIKKRPTIATMTYTQTQTKTKLAIKWHETI